MHRMNGLVDRLDAAVQFVVDHAHQCAQFTARRIQFFGVAQFERHDELLEARVSAVHLSKTFGVVAGL